MNTRPSRTGDLSAILRRPGRKHQDGGETGAVVSKGRRADEPASARAATDPVIIDLIGRVRDVRTTLAIDLSAAAGALDEDQPEIAGEILAATAADLAVLGHSSHAPGSDHPAIARRSRRTRVLLALPAVPLVGALAMTTAVALSDGSTHATHHVASTSAPSGPILASTTLQRLEHVVSQHPKAAQVLAVADDLHQQLTRMIVTSTNDPAQLHVVQQLLALEQHVLESSKVPGTQLALAASREVAKLLAHLPRHTQPKHSFSSHTTPTSAPTTQPKATTPPAPTRTQQVPQSHPTSSPTQNQPSPKPSSGLFGQGFFQLS